MKIAPPFLLLRCLGCFSEEQPHTRDRWNPNSNTRFVLHRFTNSTPGISLVPSQHPSLVSQHSHSTQCFSKNSCDARCCIPYYLQESRQRQWRRKGNPTGHLWLARDILKQAGIADGVRNVRMMKLGKGNKKPQQNKLLFCPPISLLGSQS